MNLNTPSSVLWKEFSEDYAKCTYWFYKKKGGESEVQRLRYLLELKVIRTGKMEVSDIVEYTSKNGNRWIAYLLAMYVGNRVRSTCMCFAYYQTYGSYGAFVPLYDNRALFQGQLNGMHIFTSHFFLRAKDRLKIQLTSIEDLAKAVVFSPELTCQHHVDQQTGLHRVDYQLPQGIARGIVHSSSPLLIEVRTCLSQEALSRKQARDTASMRELDAILPKTYGLPTECSAQQGVTKEELWANRRKGFAMLCGSAEAFDLCYDLAPIVAGFLKDSYQISPKDNSVWCHINEDYPQYIAQLWPQWAGMSLSEKRDAVARLIVAVVRVCDLPKTKFSIARSYVAGGDWEKWIGHVWKDSPGLHDPHIRDLILQPTAAGVENSKG